jgi:hypothetical protein
MNVPLNRKYSDDAPLATLPKIKFNSVDTLHCEPETCKHVIYFDGGLKEYIGRSSCSCRLG